MFKLVRSKLLWPRSNGNGLEELWEVVGLSPTGDKMIPKSK